MEAVYTYTVTVRVNADGPWDNGEAIKDHIDAVISHRVEPDCDPLVFVSREEEGE